MIINVNKKPNVNMVENESLATLTHCMESISLQVKNANLDKINAINGKEHIKNTFSFN